MTKLSPCKVRTYACPCFHGVGRVDVGRRFGGWVGTKGRAGMGGREAVRRVHGAEAPESCVLFYLGHVRRNRVA